MGGRHLPAGPRAHRRAAPLAGRRGQGGRRGPGAGAGAAPIAVGFWRGEALGGLLAGALVAGVMMAIFMSNAGGAWDNAKKFIESRAEEGKGSDAHHAAVVGDTVGDPFKDTAGPSINILIKLMSVVSLVLAPLM